MIIKKIIFYGSFISQESNLWGNPELVWFHVPNDIITALMYWAIAIGLIYLVRNQPNFPIDKILLLLGAFLAVRGVSYLAEVLISRYPNYWHYGLIKVIITSISGFITVGLIVSISQILTNLNSSRKAAGNQKVESHLPKETQPTQQALQESEERFRNAFDYAAIGMALVGLDGKWLKVNRSLCEILGYSEEEFLTTNFQSLTHPDDLNIDLDYAGQLLKGEIRYYHLEKRYFHKQGRVISILLSGSIVRDAKGQPLYFIAQIKDITERKRAEEALRQSEKRLQYLLISSPAIIFSAKPKGDYGATYISENVFRVLGYQAKEFLENSNFWIDRIHPDDRERITKELPKVFEKEIYSHEYRFLHADGNFRWLYAELSLVKDRDGKPVEVVGYLVDISDRKQFELEIIQIKDLREAIFNASTDAIFLVDSETLLTVDCNRRAIEMFEATSKTELINIEGQTLQKNPFTAEEWDNLMREITKRGVWSTELEYFTKTDKLFWGNLTVKQIQVADRKINIVRVTDITERLQAEKKIKQSLQEKEVLLKEVHHRVKNNLQVICSLLNLQSRSLQDPTTIEIFKESQNRVRSMALIHEKLYGSKDMAKVNFSDYIIDLVTYLFRSYEVNSDSISFQSDLNRNIFLELDWAVPCGLIINELVSNSLKYAFPKNKKGKIYLQTDIQQEEKMMIVVNDDGIGFPPDFNLKSQKTLGLKLVEILINQLEGDLEIKQQGQGIEFKIIFHFKS